MRVGLAGLEVEARGVTVADDRVGLSRQVVRQIVVAVQSHYRRRLLYTHTPSSLPSLHSAAFPPTKHLSGKCVSVLMAAAHPAGVAVPSRSGVDLVTAEQLAIVSRRVIYEVCTLTVDGGLLHLIQPGWNGPGAYPTIGGPVYQS